jgi:hypothetical protein
MVRGGSQPVGPDAVLVPSFTRLGRDMGHRAGLQDVRGGHRNRRDSRTYRYGRTWWGSGSTGASVKGELKGRKEEMPKVGREGNMACSEGGNEVIFTGTYCPFSRISPVIIRGDIFYRNIFVCKNSF